MSNSTSKTKFIFPEESSTIILNILERHGLKETDEEFYEKWEKKEKSREEILVDLVIKISEINLSVPESVNLVKKELNIPTQRAQKIIDDLTRKVIIPATQVPKKIPPIGKLLSIEELKNQENPR